MKHFNFLKAIWLAVLTIPFFGINQSFGQCTTPGPGQVAVEVVVNTVSFAGEVYWEITDSSNTTIASVPAGTYPTNNTSYGGSFNVNHLLCLDTNMTYTFKAYDSFGDGWNGGTYEVRSGCVNTIFADNGGTTPNNGVGGANGLESSEAFSVFPDTVTFVDIGVTAFVSPGNPHGSGGQNVTVVLTNLGTDTIINPTIGWSMDGVTQTPFIAPDTLLPCGSFNQYVLDSVNFTGFQIDLCAWSIDTNDTDNSNDSTCITLIPPPVYVSAAQDSAATCLGYADGGATATATLGTPPYTYAWSNGDTGASVVGLDPGTYTITVTDSLLMTSTTTVTIGSEKDFAVDAFVDSNLTCSGFTDGGLTAITNQKVTLYFEGFEDYSGTGTYSANATLSGLTGVSFETSGSPGRLRAPASSSYVRSGNVSMTMDVSTSGAYIVNYLIKQWDITAHSGTVMNLDFFYMHHGEENHANDRVWIRGSDTDPWIEVYNLYANRGSTGNWNEVSIANIEGILTTNGQTLTSTFAIRFGQEDNFPSSSTTASDGFTFDDIAITTPYTGSTAFAWSTGDTTSFLTGVAGGMYYVTATDTANCMAIDSGMVVDPGVVTPNFSINDVSCYNMDDGTVLAMPQGGTWPYSYTWSNGDSVAFVDSLPGGVYSVTVVDANGCVGDSSATVVNPDTLTAGSMGIDISCNGLTDGQVMGNPIGGTAPFSFTWSNAATTDTVSNLGAGTYYVTIMDAEGCTTDDSATVIDPPILTLSSTVDSNVSCAGDTTGQATITPMGGTMPYSYSWTNGGTGNVNNQLWFGVHYVTLTDARGCEISDSVSVTQNTQLLAVITGFTNPACNGDATGSASANAVGGATPYTFSWSNGDMGKNLTGIAAGTYTLTVHDAAGCQQSSTVNITQPNPLTGTMVNVMDISCNAADDGEASILATGGTAPYSYSWSNGDMTVMASSLGSGYASVMVTDANNCTYSDSVMITEPMAVVASISSSSNVNCNGGVDGSALAAAVGGTGTYSMVWSNGASGSLASNLMSGTYGVTVSDANNCMDSSSVTITEPTAVALTMSSTDVTCNGLMDGSATVVATGGTSGYSYSWTNGQSTANASGLGAGNVSVTVVDINGCTMSANALISEPIILTASSSVVDVTCNGGTDGSSIVAAMGGTAPYTYSWSNGATTASASSLTAGTYSYTVTDANGCMESSTDMVNEPAAIVVNLGGDQVLCNSDSMTLAAALGFTSYAWNNGASGVSLGVSSATLNLGANVLGVTVTDGNGCMGSDSIEVTLMDPVVAAISGDNELCSYEIGSISADAGFNGYSWSNGASGQTLNLFATNLTAGTHTYMVTVTDQYGCEGEASADVEIHPEIIVNLPADTNVWKYPEFTIYAPAGFASYVWNTGVFTDSLMVNSTGVYSLTVTDSLTGCEGSGEITVNFVLGLEEEDGAQLSVYPNPASDVLNIQLDNFNGEPVEVTLLSVTGQRLYNRIIPTNGVSENTTLDVSNYASGTYFIRFESNGVNEVRSIVIR